MGNCLAVAALAAHLGSVHTHGGYNNVNPGLSVRTDCGIVAGTYYNSQKRESFYLGYSYELPRTPLFATLALTTGYRSPRSGKKFAVAPLPMVGVKLPIADHWRVVLGYVPQIRPSNTHVGHLMVEYKF